MKQISTAILALVLCAFALPAQAQTTTLSKINKKLACAVVTEDDTATSSDVVTYTGTLEEFSITSYRNFKNLIRKFRQRFNSTGQGKFKRFIRLLKRCRRQAPNRSGGGIGGGGSSSGGSGGGSGGGGGGGGTGGSGSTSDAPCAVAGDSSESDRVGARIINGVVCEQGDSPVVRITMRFDSNLNDGSPGQALATCTGTFVRSNVVVFAAHCVHPISYGDTVPNQVSISYMGETYVTSEVGVGFDYMDEFNFTSDGIPGNDDAAIAVFSSQIAERFVDILDSDDLEPGETIVIAGFGNNDDSTPGTDSGTNDGQLRAGKGTIFISTEEEILMSFNYTENTTPGENSNTCVGDSGGPLFVLRNGYWVLAGITSYGRVGCGPSDLSGFANITDPAIQSFINPYL